MKRALGSALGMVFLFQAAAGAAEAPCQDGGWRAVAPRDLKDPWASERLIDPSALALELKPPWTEAAPPAGPLTVGQFAAEQELKPIWSEDEDEDVAPPVQFHRDPLVVPATALKSPWDDSTPPLSPAPCGDKK